MGVMLCMRAGLPGVVLCFGVALAGGPPVPHLRANGPVVVGFLGGFEHWNDEHRGVRRVALDLRAHANIVAETFGNHDRKAAMRALRSLLDTNGDGKLDDKER